MKKQRFVTYRNIAYVRIMTKEEITQLPVAEKFQIMETIWEDFHTRFERSDISKEQKDLLDRRRKRVESGEAKLLDWDDVKSAIGRA